MSKRDAVAETKADPNRSVREDELVAEIEALRQERDHYGQFIDRVKHLVAEARVEALEDAAQACEREADTPGQMHASLRCAAVIRKLKERGDE